MKIVPGVAHSPSNAGLKTQKVIEVEYKTIIGVCKLNLRQLDGVLPLIKIYESLKFVINVFLIKIHS